MVEFDKELEKLGYDIIYNMASNSKTFTKSHVKITDSQRSNMISINIGDSIQTWRYGSMNIEELDSVMRDVIKIAKMEDRKVKIKKILK